MNLRIAAVWVMGLEGVASVQAYVGRSFVSRFERLMENSDSSDQRSCTALVDLAGTKKPTGSDCRSGGRNQNRSRYYVLT